MAKAQTIRTAMLGKVPLRLVLSDGRYHGLADGKPILVGDDADDVWRPLHDEAGRADPRYFGFDGARNRFLHWFEGGFQSPRFLIEERKYKVDAKIKLDAAAPVEMAATGSGFGEAALKAFQGTNLLSLFEKALRHRARAPRPGRPTVRRPRAERHRGADFALQHSCHRRGAHCARAAGL